MNSVFGIPDDAIIRQAMEGHWLVPVYSGEALIMLLDKRYVVTDLPVEPDAPPVEPPPTPPPTPTPTPPQTELYEVVSEERLNVRKEPKLGADIVRRLNPGDEFVLIVGAKFDDTVNDILWRNLLDGGWVAVSRDGVVYAKAVDTSVRGG